MSVTEMIEDLPKLTFEERQLLVRHALELDNLPISDADTSLAESRLTALRDAPASAVSLKEMKSRLRSRRRK